MPETGRLQSVRASVVGVMACLLKNEPASQRHVARLTRVCGVVVAKANPNEGEV